MKKTLGCFGEVIAELVLTAVLFLIGWGVLSLFDVGLDSDWLDDDLILLIGIGALVALFGILAAVIKVFKRKKKKAAAPKGDDNEETK